MDKQYDTAEDIMEQHLVKAPVTLGFTDWKREEIICEIQEAEATWLANKCVKNLEDGIDLIFVLSRNPNKYFEMSDDKLRTIKRLIGENKDFDFFLINNIKSTFPTDNNYPMFTNGHGGDVL